jgi:hypothetical protein
MSNGLAGGDMAGNVGSDFVRVPRFLFEDSPQLAKKVADFEALQLKAQEAAAVLGGIDEIEGIRAQLKRDTEATDQALADALDQAEAIATESKNQAQLTVDKATQEASRIVAEANSVAAEAEQQRAQAAGEVTAVKRDRTALTAREKELDGTESNLHQKADDLARREQELAGEKSKLAAARDAINAAL